jgi:signal recognition particle-docking protein FtsY
MLLGTGLAFYFGKALIQPQAPQIPFIALGNWSDSSAVRSALQINALVPLGVALAQRLPQALLLGIFAVFMLYTAWRMGRSAPAQAARHVQPACVRPDGELRLRWTPRCAAVLARVGGTAGLFSGLLGVGGGFVIAAGILATFGVVKYHERAEGQHAAADALRAEMSGRLEGADRALHLGARAPGSPTVWLFVGVNGVGKTTTIGKVGALQRAEGRTVLMAAGDTFRAAAAEQLATWAERSGSEFVRGSEGGDPSSVIFDGVERAAARDIDLVLGDTAGRLHTKTNLMDELRKVRRVAGKGAGRVEEVLLVIDATTGQNGLTQARQFGDALEHDDAGVSGLTGVVLTKLDGSAKGGIVFAIETELGVPVKLVGLGETINDLVPFDPVEFVDALFADS